MDNFEREFLIFVAKSKAVLDAAACFKMDGQADDLQNLKPLVVDDPDSGDCPARRMVRRGLAVTCQGTLS